MTTLRGRSADVFPGVRAVGWLATVPPGAGAAVMATGIVSIGLHLTGRDVLSEVFLTVTAALWVLLAVAFAVRLAADRSGWIAASANPPALTAVAATCVLGTRLSLLGAQRTALALLALGAVAWPWLLLSVLRHLRRPAPGAAFLVCVATEGLAVLAATLASAGQGDWLAWAALAACLLGVVLYAEALRRFDLGQVLTGSGDHWIAAGALAISALAASKLTASPVWTGAGHGALRVLTFVLLGLDLAWYAVLAVCEVLRPRPHYDLRRWSTVFPLGMSAVACLSTAQAGHVRQLHGTGTVLLWIALAAWLLVAAGFAAHVARGREAGRPRF
ncbi:tellurite resistance/C4-dicarboxylate transporter family protein [Streptomyces sp. NPDC020983]|uniref:tellurite resistance/C4-dicarboxylate transporter family protein n=1 Tax=Streptomyces sp. NPDC020983 TaxID=3365106 RepID=UPI0037AA8DEB